MKITFKTAELQARLAQVGAVVAKKAATPVYKNVRLYTEANELGALAVKLTGADIDATLTVTLLEAKADGEVDVLLPYEQLAKQAGLVIGAETTITITNEKAQLSGTKERAVLRPTPSDTWPEALPVPEQYTAALDLQGFQRQLDLISFAIPDATGKFTAAVAKVESDDQKLRVVATDGFILAISDVPKQVGAFELMIPKPAVDHIKRLTSKGTINVGEVEAGFFFDTDTERLTVNRINATFPPYGGILKALEGATPTTIVVPDAKELSTRVQFVQVSGDVDKPLAIFSSDADGKALGIAASSNVSDEAGTFVNNADNSIDATCTGAATKFALDASKLVPAVEKIEGAVTIKFVDVNKVVDFTGLEGQYRFLQVPSAVPQA